MLAFAWHSKHECLYIHWSSCHEIAFQLSYSDAHQTCLYQFSLQSASAAVLWVEFLGSSCWAVMILTLYFQWKRNYCRKKLHACFQFYRSLSSRIFLVLRLQDQKLEHFFFSCVRIICMSPSVEKTVSSIFLQAYSFGQTLRFQYILFFLKRWKNSYNYYLLRDTNYNNGLLPIYNAT